MLGTYYNWNIIKLTNKTTSIKDFDEINIFVLDGVSDNMSWLVNAGKYGDISTTYPITMGYYAFRFISNIVTLKE